MQLGRRQAPPRPRRGDPEKAPEAKKGRLVELAEKKSAVDAQLADLKKQLAPAP